MRSTRRHILQIPIYITVFLLGICVILSIYPSSNPPISVKRFIDSRNGDLGIEQVIALTEVDDEFDLVFYYTLSHQITANILLKNEDGQYSDLIMTTAQSPDCTNRVLASSRVSCLSKNSLYWGIAQSSDWRINHPNSHQIVADTIVLGYYLHDKSLDEELLDLKFVYSKS